VRDPTESMNRDPNLLLERHHEASSAWCLFLDVDGTLLDFAASPEHARVPAGLTTQLERLHASLAGAVALVSGRPVAELDRLFSPLRLPAAGVHGLERRPADSPMQSYAGDSGRLGKARDALRALAASHRGLHLQDKGGALALHFQDDLELAALARRSAYRAARGLGSAYQVLAGRRVFELTPVVPNKGTAITAFLAEPPFAGRTPVFLGDDVGDRAGFRAVARHGGIPIAVGPWVSAPWKLRGASAVRNWLEALLRREQRPQ
jgi:trehalose 6-phosphate phosphatase